MRTKEEIKKSAAIAAMEFVRPGMTLGIGTGSTVYWFIQELAKKINEGLQCSCIPTSLGTRQLATELGIPLLDLNDVEKIDLTIDGADEVDPQLRLIKGGGGALLQEKMVAAASGELIIIADKTKLVKQLGAFPLPVEVIPYGWKQVQRHITALYDIASNLRAKDGKTFLTDHGHYILDCHFGVITAPDTLTIKLNMIPGVVENGLFINMAAKALIAQPGGAIETLSAK